MSGMQELTDSDFERETASGRVLVDFYGSWCAPCKTMAPVLEKVAKLVEGRSRIVKADVEKSPDAVKRFGLRSVPSFVLMKDGQMAGIYTGVQSEGFLLRLLEE